jgi:hypothetical protein
MSKSAKSDAMNAISMSKNSPAAATGGTLANLCRWAITWTRSCPLEPANSPSSDQPKTAASLCRKLAGSRLAKLAHQKWPWLGHQARGTVLLEELVGKRMGCKHQLSNQLIPSGAGRISGRRGRLRTILRGGLRIGLTGRSTWSNLRGGAASAMVGFHCGQKFLS